jgi:hypothetical protein
VLASTNTLLGRLRGKSRRTVFPGLGIPDSDDMRIDLFACPPTAHPNL